MHTHGEHRSEKKGVWLAVTSGLLYGLLGYFGVTLMRSGMSVYNVSFWRFLVAFLFVALVSLIKKRNRTSSTKDSLITFCNGALFYNGAGIFFFLATDYIGTGQAMVIFFIYPIWVMVLNWLFLGQSFKPHYIFSLAVIVAGLILLVDITEVKFDFLGIRLSIGASFCYAIYLFVSKRLQLDPLDSTALVTLGCALLCLIIAMGGNTFFVPMAMEQWIYIICFAVICSSIPIVLMLEAMKYLSADKASLLSVTEPVFTVIFGVILLHEVLSINNIVGMILTLLGALMVIVRWPLIFKRKLPHG